MVNGKLLMENDDINSQFTTHNSELKEGYKQTEVGIIPSDWMIKSLGEIASIKDGTHQTPRYFDSGIPFYSVESITSNDFTNTKYISEEEHQFLTKTYKIEKGDILMTRIGSIGDCKYVDWEPNASFYVSLALLKVNKSFNAEYICHFTRTAEFKREIDLNSLQHAIPKKINLGQISYVKLALPKSYTEQTAIATALSDADSYIASLEKLIAKKRLIKHGAMQELLKPKEGWVVKKLGELFEITSSKRVYQNEWRNKGVPFYRARELALLSEKGVVNNELFITKEKYEFFKKQFGVPAIGDMLVTGVGTLGKTFIVNSEREFYFKDGNIIWFKIRSSMNSYFLKQLFLTKLITKQIEDASAGTTVGTYTITSAKNTLIMVPPVDEQAKIATILTDIDAEILAWETKLEKMRTEKLGMMQQLLAGKIRLN